MYRHARACDGAAASVRHEDAVTNMCKRVHVYDVCIDTCIDMRKDMCAGGTACV